MLSGKRCALFLMAVIMCIDLTACSFNSTRPEDPASDYTPSSCLASFKDTDSDKVLTKGSFDVSAVNTRAREEDLSVNMLFGDGMCLQRDCVNKVWGTCSSISDIAVVFCGKTYYGRVNGTQWSVYLPKMNAGGPYSMDIVCDKGKVTFSDVYVGEVFLLSGQSNMEWKVMWSDDRGVLKDLYSDKEACKNEQIRMLDLPANPKTTPQTAFNFYPEWTYARSGSIKTFSAIGYLVGKQLQEELNCPIGLISTAVGGSIIEYWLSEQAYNELLQTGYTPVLDRNNPLFTPSLGYNGLIHPLIGWKMRGVLWYQGCSNTLGTQTKYDVALKKYIDMMRKTFDTEELTFVVFELARYKENVIGYSQINERIAAVDEEDPFVTRVVNLDQGEWNDIHPRNKKPIAQRGANALLSAFFGIEKPQPPKLLSYQKTDERTVELTLDTEIELRNGKNGFQIYTSGGWSDDLSVTCLSNKITLSSEEPFSAIRYGYTCAVTEEIKTDVSKMVTVYSSDGLPLDLFHIELKE